MLPFLLNATSMVAFLALIPDVQAYMRESGTHHLPSRSRGRSNKYMPRNKMPINDKRQLPADATGVTTIKSPSGAQIRYKQPGKAGVCETTSGVNSYTGYVDLDATTHMFFWFFESRNDPAEDPLTLWLNGGPGSDSLIGLFQELGSCNVTEDLKTEVNPYSWNEISNLLFLSQPIGVGFSYETEGPGSIDPTTGLPQNASFGTPDGIYSFVDPSRTLTTDQAAVGAWEVLQGFMSNLETLDSGAGIAKDRQFNLWTESYGGHYGPSFYNYFYGQNQAIMNGSIQGIPLTMATLGIGNGIYDEGIQAPYYPEFAVNNTYGIKAVNDTIYNLMKQANTMSGGCQELTHSCSESLHNNVPNYTTCAQATTICRDGVEVPYYEYSGRGTYDIRHPSDDPTPPTYFEDFLNLASTQQALGVNINYTSDSSIAVGTGFTYSGDFDFPMFKDDLEMILNNGVRVALYHGDADYICNWFGGQAVSLALNFSYAEQFRAADYAPFMVNGTEYGEVRQAGNFSFLRVYEAGHEVPFYQPLASLEMFRRVLGNLIVADGSEMVTLDYSTNGTATATHTEPFVALPSATSSGGTDGGTSAAMSLTGSASSSATVMSSHGERSIKRPGFFW
ncbi:hypothetical protein MMC25_002663 [Agyrium rufum]|nr:hypothetical protein [Agyrium rufum]